MLLIDFDGTLAQWRNFPEIGPPVEGAKEALDEFRKMGYEIQIWSCRTSSELIKHPIDRTEQVRKMREWLEQHEFCYDFINIKDKPIATYYIGDEVIECKNNWSEIVERVKNG